LPLYIHTDIDSGIAMVKDIGSKLGSTAEAGRLSEILPNKFILPGKFTSPGKFISSGKVISAGIFTFISAGKFIWLC